MYSSGNSPAIAAIELEKSLTSYSQWYCKNMLVLNAAKTNIITLSIKKIKLKSLPKVKFESLTLSQKDYIKYLGFYLDKNLNVKAHLSDGVVFSP